MSDPEIDVFDVSAHAGMELYAADSDARMAPLFRAMGYPRNAEMHEDLARKYRLADRVMAEVVGALAEEIDDGFARP